MSEKFTVEIISPDRLIIKTNAIEVNLPSYEGEIGILKDHIPLITFLRPGIIKIIDEKEKTFFVEEGTVEFSNNKLLVLTSTASELSTLNKNLVGSLIKEAEKKINSNEITDKERYILTYKIDTLKSISK